MASVTEEETVQRNKTKKKETEMSIPKKCHWEQDTNLQIYKRLFCGGGSILVLYDI